VLYTYTVGGRRRRRWERSPASALHSSNSFTFLFSFLFSQLMIRAAAVHVLLLLLF
jgi:hypothetical protein